MTLLLLPKYISDSDNWLRWTFDWEGRLLWKFNWKAFGATIFGFKERLCDGLKSLLWSFKWKSFLGMCLSLGFKEVLWSARWGDNCVSWSFVVCFSRQVGIIVICWLLEQEHSNCTFLFPLCGWHMNDRGCLCCHDNHYCGGELLFLHYLHWLEVTEVSYDGKRLSSKPQQHHNICPMRTWCVWCFFKHQRANQFPQPTSFMQCSVFESCIFPALFHLRRLICSKARSSRRRFSPLSRLFTERNPRLSDKGWVRLVILGHE